MVQTASMFDRPCRNLRFHLARKLFQNRILLSFLYLRGNGIEIGALHNPLRVSPLARVKYVDRMTVADLRKHYPELKGKKLAPVDILDDGERLFTIPDGSQDFLIANHFLEHCENPLLALKNFFRVLRSDGFLYLALPDKRYTFDRKRPATRLEHLQRIYEDGPEWARRGHYREWVNLFNDGLNDKLINKEVERLMAMDYSIHHHAWTQWEMMELLLYFRKHCPCEVEIMLRHKEEVIFIIRNESE